MLLAIGLLVAAVALCFLEILVVSFGLMTALALACAAGSCWAAYRSDSPDSVWLFVFLNLAGMTAAFLVSFRFFSARLALRKTQVEEGGYQTVANLANLVGRTGVAFTTLRPGGTALIDGQKVDVVAFGGFIEKDARVKVLSVEGIKVVVEREVL